MHSLGWGGSVAQFCAWHSAGLCCSSPLAESPDSHWWCGPPGIWLWHIEPPVLPQVSQPAPLCRALWLLAKQELRRMLGNESVLTNDTSPLLVVWCDLLGLVWCCPKGKMLCFQFPFKLSSFLSPLGTSVRRGPLCAHMIQQPVLFSVNFLSSGHVHGGGKVLPPSSSLAWTSSSQILLLGHQSSWLGPKGGKGNLLHSGGNSAGVGNIDSWYVGGRLQNFESLPFPQTWPSRPLKRSQETQLYVWKLINDLSVL